LNQRGKCPAERGGEGGRCRLYSLKSLGRGLGKRSTGGLVMKTFRAKDPLPFFHQGEEVKNAKGGVHVERAKGGRENSTGEDGRKFLERVIFSSWGRKREKTEKCLFS